MANYQRYQTLSAAEQHLFSASCPVWVNRYQISWDTQTGARLLQARMVNLSEKAITAVYLRVHCRDAQDQALTTLHLVPVTGLMVMPGEVFGDDKIVQLWPRRTAFAELYAERVCFSDGTAWNESEPTDYFAIPAPKPVRPTDPAYAHLALTAREGGVRNDFYYQAALTAWLCTCGVPNPHTVLRCRHCGAERSWLEQHMNAETLLAPKPAEPEPEPTPADPEPAAPELAAPLEKFDLASYLSSEPIAVSAPPEEEFPRIAAAPEPPAPAAPPQKQRHPGRVVAIVLAIVLFLGVGAWFGYQRLLKPYLTYQDAVDAENSKDYETAIGIYQQLGDYSDSPHRILWCKAQLALEQLQQGNYAEAYEMFRELEQTEGFETLEGFETKAADCLYSMGVTAYNQGDLDTAWSCVEQLELEYPSYADTEELRDCCCYGFGKQAIERAQDAGDERSERNAYEEAKQWFASAGDYSNSAEMVQYCDYYIADSTARMARGDYEPSEMLEAMGKFAALGDYSDSRHRRLDCMFEYVNMTMDPEDENTLPFLEELIDEDYTGAQELYEQLFHMTVDLLLLTEPDANGARQQFGTTAKLADLEKLYISYSVNGGRESDTVQILLIYTLPGTAGGRITLNADGTGVNNSRSGIVRLYDLTPVKATKAGEVKLQFYDAETGEELNSFKITVPVETTTTDSTSGNNG